MEAIEEHVPRVPSAAWRATIYGASPCYQCWAIELSTLTALSKDFQWSKTWCISLLAVRIAVAWSFWIEALEEYLTRQSNFQADVDSQEVEYKTWTRHDLGSSETTQRLSFLSPDSALQSHYSCTSRHRSSSKVTWPPPPWRAFPLLLAASVLSVASPELICCTSLPYMLSWYSPGCAAISQ